MTILRRINVAPEDEKTFYELLLHRGFLVYIDSGQHGLMDVVEVCFFSKRKDEMIKILCNVVGRKFSQGEDFPNAVTIRVTEGARPFVKKLLDSCFV